MPQQDEWVRQGLVYRTTTDIINAAKDGRLPDQIMMTFHPQRWTDAFVPWVMELLWQSAKNVVKAYRIRRMKKKQIIFLADHLRTRLKLKNPGSPAIPLLRRELEAMQKAGFGFCTVKEFVETRFP